MSAQEFVLLASQRTGSTLLVRSLDSAPEIFCAGEIFHTGPRTHHRQFQYPYQRTGKGLVARAARLFLQERRVGQHLANFYGEAGKGVRAVGFKLMVSQTERYPAILGCLRERRVARIFLHRRSTFDAALSYCVAAATGRYHSDRQPETEEPGLVTIDEAEFRCAFRACDMDRARLLDLHDTLGGLLLAYEDVFRDWCGSIARIGEHLGVPGLRVGKSLDKLSAADAPRVANVDDLRGLFRARRGR